ncbi:SRPBCC family protein [Candidatus Formimonas warabiya]|uniref:Polyketide cyclase n=1 Tax=Formimonas warabiya TaxID=1761012 RepID=A0A3G1KNR5_FORW1|nr:SRPBCC family protein [Candidatus Formimonas warabiya]ATW23755.1 polyketide cyclase [Candidatus Formimonas warabiya]
METYQLTRNPVVKAEMLIRKPVAEVYEAFINPAITTKFWFTKSSGRLEPNKQIQWDWEMYNLSVRVSVKEIEQNKRILVEWSMFGTSTTVEWLFTPIEDNATFVSISSTGFKGDGDEIVDQVIGCTEGFALVLSGLKAFLEHNIILNLVSDRFPNQQIQ